MILWHDSLHYSSVDHLTEVYPLAGSFTVGAPHAQSGKASIQAATSCILDIPAFAGNGIGEETVLIGFRFQCTVLPSSKVPLIHIRTGGGTVLIKISIKAEGAKAVFDVESGDSKALFLRSNPIDVTSDFVFIEFKIRITADGIAELRVNGTQDTYAEQADLLRGSLFNWDHVRLVPQGGTYRFSDIYLSDGVENQQLLGPVDSTRIFPAKAVVKELGWNPALKVKKVIVVLAGQSNINGRGVISPYTGKGRSVNTKVFVWDPLASPSENWVPLEPGFGCTNIEKTWALEMMFAEKVASLLEVMDPATKTEVYIVRMGFDASYVYSGIPVFTWNPAWPGNHSDKVLNTLNTAVLKPNISGWGNVDHVDVFWFQGESEAVGLGIGIAGLLSFIQDTNDVFDYIEAGIPVPVNWHRAIIQNIPSPAWNGQYLRPIQRIQESNILRGRIIETRDLVRFKDDLIHMGEEDQDKLGVRLFESWLDAQNYGQYLSDYFYNDDPTYEPLFIGSDTIGSSCSFLHAPELKYDLINSVVLALNAKQKRSSSNDGKFLNMKLGDISIPPSLLDVSAQWSFRYLQYQNKHSPEQVTGAIKCLLS